MNYEYLVFFVPILMLFAVLGLAWVLDLQIKNSPLSIALSACSFMAVPFALAGIFQQNIQFGFALFALLVSALSIHQLITVERSNIFLSRSFCGEFLLTCLIALVVVFPSYLSGGLPITHPNYDFIYQSVDAHFMAKSNPTVFESIQTGGSDLPLDWSANQQGRYLSSVLQAVVSEAAFSGNYVYGSLAVFQFFILLHILATFIAVRLVAKNKWVFFAVIMTALVSIAGWSPIRFMLIGQLSATPIYLMLISSLLIMLTKGEVSKKQGFAVYVCVGMLLSIYFAVGFFAGISVGLFFLYVNRRHISILLRQLSALAVFSGFFYFAPYFSKPSVVIEVVAHWFEVILSKMYSNRAIDEVAVEYLSEFIAFRLIGIDPQVLWTFGHVNSASTSAYVLLVAVSVIGLILLLYSVARTAPEIRPFLALLWAQYIGFSLLFFITQSGYLVFKTLGYLYFVPLLTLASALPTLNSIRLRALLSGILVVVFLSNLFEQRKLTSDFAADRLGMVFGADIANNNDVADLGRYLKNNVSDKPLYLALPTVNQQAMIALYTSDFKLRGLTNNHQNLENARWKDDACDLPNFTGREYLVVPSRKGRITDASYSISYVEPLFENQSYAVVEEKNLQELVLFSRGFYFPEPIKLEWNGTFDVARWSTGKSAVIVRRSGTNSLLKFSVLTYGDLDLKLRKNDQVDKSIELKGAPYFTGEEISLDGAPWTCLIFEGKTSFEQEKLNRFLFPSRHIDPRPIQFLIGGLEIK